MKLARGLISNDLMDSLGSTPSQNANYNYTVVAQSATELQDVQNSPTISMGPYLIASEQTHLLTTLSVYGMRGDSRDQVRLLYMNAVALHIWKEMGMQPNLVGSLHRPPHSALLFFGVPFSD
jgi:hypothetical protein